jgi:FkbM family methyltransferase
MYREVNGRWGFCRFFGKDEYVGRSMFSYGEYNPDETEMILSLAAEQAQKTDMHRCLDIGANIGCISQALLHEGFIVEAFEPQPELFELLEYNARCGVCHNTACGDKIGFATMPKVQYSAKGNFGGLGLFEKSIYGDYKVPVLTIDSLEYDDVVFIKIDVEGYELEVLKGATKTINRLKPIMYIEDDRSEKSHTLRAYINALGYTIEEHKPTLYRDRNFFGLHKNIWGRNYASHNLICRPL